MKTETTRYSVILWNGDVEIGRTHYEVVAGLTLEIADRATADRIGRSQVEAHGGSPYTYTAESTTK